jgi:hypothetical protein
MLYKHSQVKEYVPIYARGFCAERYRLEHPGCSEEEAWRHAERHWRDFVDMAIDFMALDHALTEQEAAPFN